MDTTSGWFTGNTTSVSSIYLDNQFHTAASRNPGLQTLTFQGPNGEETKAANYLSVRIMSSNREISISRSYNTLIDVASDVGGISEAVTFLFLILVFLHNDVSFEQSVLNKALLQEEQA